MAVTGSVIMKKVRQNDRKLAIYGLCEAIFNDGDVEACIRLHLNQPKMSAGAAQTLLASAINDFRLAVLTSLRYAGAYRNKKDVALKKKDASLGAKKIKMPMKKGGGKGC